MSVATVQAKIDALESRKANPVISSDKIGAGGQIAGWKRPASSLIGSNVFGYRSSRILAMAMGAERARAEQERVMAHTVAMQIRETASAMSSVLAAKSADLETALRSALQKVPYDARLDVVDGIAETWLLHHAKIASAKNPDAYATTAAQNYVDASWAHGQFAPSVSLDDSLDVPDPDEIPDAMQATDAPVSARVRALVDALSPAIRALGERRANGETLNNADATALRKYRQRHPELVAQAMIYAGIGMIGTPTDSL